MSAASITTSVPVPTADIPLWCVQQQSPRAQLFNQGCPRPIDQVANWPADDNQSFCCDGVIVNTAFDIYDLPPSSPLLPLAYDNNGTRPVRLADLVCCGIDGIQTAALDPRPSIKTACAAGSRSTPLLSLAASVASDASLFPVSYALTSSNAESDSPSATVTNDLWGWATPTYGASGTPVCFYANTASGVDISLAEVTVPATYVAPSSSGASTGTGTATTEEAAAASTSVPSAGFSATRSRRGDRIWAVTLGLVATSLFLR